MSRPDPQAAAVYLRLIRGESRGIGPGLARVALTAASGGYGLAVTLRNAAYDRGWKTIHRAGVPVISVGNLTLGGTGKTPMVEFVARHYRERGKRAAILSRGYGSDEGINDEGRVLEENLPDVPHLQGADRATLARIAVEELESEVLVLDDGFQHRRLARDVDLVLLDALDPFGSGWVTPRGLLREPIRGLKRASICVLSRADLVDEAERTRIRAYAERKAGTLRWAYARHAPRDLTDAQGCSFAYEEIVGRSVIAFCGIGNPEGFRRTLETMGIVPRDFRIFPDHHPYDASDIARLAQAAREEGAELVLTTQKDLVKVRTTDLGGIPLRALRIGLEPLEGGEALVETLDRAIS